MPYAYRHTVTGTLLAAWQTNGYKLNYYGIVTWESEPTATAAAEALAQAGISPGDAAGRLEEWGAVQLTEHEAKLANVKLRNNPARVVFYRDGALGVGTASDS